MAAKPAYDRSSYRQDIRALRARGKTWDAIARELKISRTTLWRIMRDSRPPNRRR